ncbi:ABC transporter permease OS=Streptomyces griseorubiginosus OX=67304 GN=AQJ54_33715 PE=3 SV=1 [Streptomyces griseorubiginosus]
MSVIGADRPTRPARRGADVASKAVVNGVLGLMALYTLIPLWWLFVSSTKASGYLYTGTPLWFSHFDLVTNIKNVFSFEDGIFSTWLANSALYSLVGATVGTLLSAMAGYALSNVHLPRP